MKMPELNEDLKDILGRPCFTVGHLARRLHDLKLYDVPQKAEAEQAAALHWMLSLYFEHGSNWQSEGNKILKPTP